jgi:hypothetical protein
MKTIKMQHEITEELEQRSGVKGLKLIRLKGSDPSWALGGLRDSLDKASEARLQSTVAKLQAELDMA